MRLRSPEYRGCNEKVAMAAGMVRAAVVLSIVGLGGGAGSQAAAQEAAGAVAHVEAVSGRVVALVRGAPVLLDVLDSVGDRTRLDLQANSELRLCHYSTGRLHMLRGPLRVAVSADGVTAENGKAVDRSAGSCAVPAVSKFQGAWSPAGLCPRRTRRRGPGADVERGQRALPSSPSPPPLAVDPGFPGFGRQ